MNEEVYTPPTPEHGTLFSVLRFPFSGAKTFILDYCFSHIQGCFSTEFTYRADLAPITILTATSLKILAGLPQRHLRVQSYSRLNEGDREKGIANLAMRWELSKVRDLKRLDRTTLYNLNIHYMSGTGWHETVAEAQALPPGPDFLKDEEIASLLYLISRDIPEKTVMDFLQAGENSP